MNGDPLLIHTMLISMIHYEFDDYVLCFQARGHKLRFGCEEFCLIFDLRFSSVTCVDRIIFF